MSTEDTTQDAADAAQAIIAELNANLGARRIAALMTLVKARRLIDEAGALMITQDLAEQAGKATQRLEKARAKREAADAAMKPVTDTICQLESELADVARRQANLTSVIADDLDVTARIEARSLKLAMAEEHTDLSGRIDLIRRNMLTTLGQELGEAQREEDLAADAVISLADAKDDPIGHPRSRSTDGFWTWLDAGGAVQILTAGKPGCPGWAQARRWLMNLLDSTGIGAHLQAEAVRAFRAGDPAMLAIGGNTAQIGDQTVIYDPASGAPPVVYTGKATAQQLSTGSHAQPVDSSPASTVMQQAWGQIQHQTSPGLWTHP